MRLIDEEQLVIAGDCKEIDGELYVKVSDVERCLDNAPIAYDIDKVIDQMIDKMAEKGGICFRGKNYINADVIKNAIDAVRNGGVENV